MGVEEIIASLVALALPDLEKLAAAIADEISARSEPEAMKAAVAAVDASVDAAEEEALKAGQWP